jgi:hypothetical protein
MGSKTQLTAEVLGDIVYPGIMVENGWGGFTNKKVETVEWTLPKNWKTNRNETGSFFRLIQDNALTVIPDYVNVGAIKVRGVNEVGTAYSDADSEYFDRGFSFTTDPSNITFGDATSRNFAVTGIAGLTYEWNAPVDWQINGQGNIVEGLNINEVSIVPSFCTYSKGIVRVRIKKDGDVSEWDSVPYLGVTKPSIIQDSLPVYQFEVAKFSLANINSSAIQSINWTGDGVSCIGTQGSNYKIVFSQPGTTVLTASITLIGCSTPITVTKTVTINPHRISLSGPSQLCGQGTFSINNYPSGATITWSSGDTGILSLTSGQGATSAIFSKIGNGKISVNATIVFMGRTIMLSQVVSVGVPDCPWVSNGTTISTSQTPSYTLSYGQSTTSLILTLMNPSTSATVSGGWVLEKTYGAENFNLQLYGNRVTVIPLKVGLGQFTVKGRNNCGDGGVLTVHLTISSSGFPINPPIRPLSMRISSNPASDVVAVSVNETIENESLASGLSVSSSATYTTSTCPFIGNYTLQLYGEKIGLIKTVHADQPTTQISLHGIPSGQYYIHLIVDNKIVQKQILLIH